VLINGRGAFPIPSCLHPLLSGEEGCRRRLGSGKRARRRQKAPLCTTKAAWCGEIRVGRKRTKIFSAQEVETDISPVFSGYSSPWGWWNTGPGCPEKLWLPLPGSVQGQVGWRWITAWSSGRCPCSWQGGWNQMIFKVLSNPNHSMILWFCDTTTTSNNFLPRSRLNRWGN